jgi:long-chain fatty acid transport protein
VQQNADFTGGGELGEKSGRRFFSTGFIILFLFPLIAFSMSAIAFAGGPVHGAKAAGMGTAFVGLADDPSAILFNPGGLTQIKETTIYGGVTAVSPSTVYAATSGDTARTEFQIFYPPHLYAASDFGTQDFVFGLGLYSPFGIGGRKWDPAGPTRYASVESAIATFSLNPTIAWRASDVVSLAVGIDYLRAVMKMKRMLDQSLVGAGDASSRLEADGDGWGHNLGALIRAGEETRIGLAYRSAINVNYRGDMTIEGIAPALQPLFGGTSYNSAITTSNRFPDIYSLGVSHLLSTKLVFAADVELVRWSSFKKMEVNIVQEVPAAGVTDAVTPLDWKDSWGFKIGGEYRMSDSIALRAGYAFINTPVPDHTFEPGNPDADQHNVSIGMGYRTGNWRIDGFYQIGIFQDRTVQNAVVDGEFRNIMHYLGVSVGRTF